MSTPSCHLIALHKNRNIYFCAWCDIRLFNDDFIGCQTTWYILSVSWIVRERERKWRHEKYEEKRTKLASIRPYKKFIATQKIFFYIFLVYAAAAASHRATLQQFIKFISFNWKSLTLHLFFYSHMHWEMFSHDDDDDDIVSDCCSFSNALFLLLWQLSRKQNERKNEEQKLVDENYISMTEINFKFYSLHFFHIKNFFYAEFSIW